MLKEFLLVGFGGALGSMLRFACSQIIKSNGFPYSTLAINIAGSFLLGAIISLTEKNPNLLPIKPMLAIGFCGGFTTFSAFSYESLELLKQQQYFLLAAYIIMSLLLGFLAVWGGFQLLK
jgi:CrcB protein